MIVAAVEKVERAIALNKIGDKQRVMKVAVFIIALSLFIE